MYSLKLAHLIKEHTGAEVFNFYIDMRTPGKGFEEFYQKLLERARALHSRPRGGGHRLGARPQRGRQAGHPRGRHAGRIRAPHSGGHGGAGHRPGAARRRAGSAPPVQHLLRAAKASSWSAIPSWRPVNTFTDGIFLAGCCQGPKDIPDTVAQAGAAAAEALALIDAGYVETEPNTAHVVEEVCSGCKTCISMCPYHAISFIERDQQVAASTKCSAKAAARAWRRVLPAPSGRTCSKTTRSSRRSKGYLTNA